MPTHLRSLAGFLCLAVTLPFSLCGAQERDASVFSRQVPVTFDDGPVALAVDRSWSLQRGLASWYGQHFHGRKTASGERFDMHAMTAAHPTLPIHSLVRVLNVANGRAVIVRINDRGPFTGRRIIDLSYAAARHLGYVARGNARVEIALLASGDKAIEPGEAVSLLVDRWTTLE